ncbi:MULTISPECIES: hypothetical protein [unclassified Pseudomonas]|uniref:hypothetical protein n=1 Tax=unclassified Pseudomonas TaxID=196821 RepID=UPI000ED9B09A|nr:MULTISPECIES: hypothetical protein [unclassified Pseudomonas]HBZ92502.1 hypothetical protein [Pseudomonas sp.]
MNRTGPLFATLDFINRRSALQAGWPDGPHLDGSSRNCDLLFVIDAPPDYQPAVQPQRSVIFLDQHAQPRKLPPEHFQITPAHALSLHAFDAWAQFVVQALPAPLLRNVMIGTDLTDLLHLMRACNGRRLQLFCLEFPADAQAPLEQLGGLHFRHLFTCLFGGPDLSLHHYSDAGSALEAICTEGARMVITTAMHAAPQRRLLLLGEPVTPHTAEPRP